MTKADTGTQTLPPIAVVGVGAIFPGANHAHAFWKDIVSGADRIGDVPPSHWLIGDFHDPDLAAPDKTYGKRGGFLSPVPFDPLEYGIPPNALKNTDTAQLLALIVAKQALADASSAGRSVAKDRISVILGVASATELVMELSGRLHRPVWVKALRESGLPEDEVQSICDRISASFVPWEESSFPGLLGNVVAGRIANRLDLGGSNFVTDAACASSLSAIQAGINELRLGQTDMVISGGVDALNNIFMYMCFSKTPAMSLSGDCRPFSDAADGTLLGEGVGMFALRRLADAEADGNRIYGVIRGIGSSSDGKATSVYGPRPEGQELALRRAYENAGYGPETVELVEGHGTGTKAGDVTEFAALNAVFGRPENGRRQWCALGSIKSQIGHTKAAAGAAGLFKVLMSLHHKVLPPTIKVEKPSSRLPPLSETAFHINTKARPWVHPGDRPRRASISSFGFGGSNFHVTLEEYVGPGRKPGRLRAMPAELILLSADDPAALADACDACANSDAPLAETARRTQAGFRSGAECRLSVVADSADDLKAKLASVATRLRSGEAGAIASPNGIDFATGPADPGKVAFLFPGQGSQYVGMGSDIAMAFDPARAVWDADTDATPDSETPLHRIVFPAPAFGAEEERAQFAALTEMVHAQPAIALVSASQLALLESAGLMPDCVAGHSFGEVSALAATGALERSALAAVARARATFMTEAAKSAPGAMLAVRAPREQVEPLITAWGLGITLANDNGPNQVVLSGPVEAIAEAETKLSAEGLGAKRLPVATAFHSPIVAASRQPFRAFLDSQKIAVPSVPVLANSTARPYPADADAMRDRLADQLVNAVRFRETIEAMFADGVRTFVEVGPGSVLSALVDDCLKGRSHAAIPLDRKGANGLVSLWRALGRLSVLGLNIDHAALWAEYPESEAAKTPPPPAHAVRITGANYGKVYPPQGGAEAPPKPNPPRPPEAAPQPAAQPAAPQPNAPQASGLNDFQNTLLQTHQSFQTAMMESHRAFLDMAERTLARMSGDGTALPPMPTFQAPAAPTPVVPVTAEPAPAQPPVATPTPPPSADTRTLLLDIVAEKTGYPIDMLDLDMELEAGLGVDSIKQVEILSTLRERAPNLPEVEPSDLTRLKTLGQIVAHLGTFVDAAPAPKAEPAVAPATDVGALLLDIVAEKTGYPIDMLGMDMELEAGLGVDSIKQVEILSTLRERAPHLPEMEPGDLNRLKTLGQIVAHLGEVDGGGLQAAKATPAAPAMDVGALLLDIVAEKTGYPIDMLDPAMELEAGLGVDSIKQVEILSSLRERAPHLPEMEPSELSSLKTLADIVARLEGAVGAPAPSDAPIPAAVAAPAAMTRQVLALADAPLPQGSAVRLPDGPIAIIGGPEAIAQALAERLAAESRECTRCETPPEGAGTVVCLCGIDAETSPDSAFAAHRTAFMAAKAVAARFAARGGLFVTVQDTGGDFGLNGAAGTRAWLGGLPGLAKTLAQEWPAATIKALDIATSGIAAKDVAARIAAELLTQDGIVEVAVATDGTRRVPVLNIADAERGTPSIDAHSVIAVSGGARGITTAVVEGLARNYGGRYVLFGRSPLIDEPDACAGIEDEAGLKSALFALAKQEGATPTPRELSARTDRVLAARTIRRTLARIAEAGGEARYADVDVRDEDAVRETLDAVRRDWGPITGIVHAAGVLADKRVADKTPEQMEQVFRTKVDGLRALLDATRSDPLRVICLFSSVAARFGNVGQADYAMANEVLNKVASAEAQRRGNATLVKSVNWGPWEGGMVSPALAEHFRSLGVPLIPMDVGVDFLVRELASSTARWKWSSAAN